MFLFADVGKTGNMDLKLDAEGTFDGSLLEGCKSSYNPNMIAAPPTPQSKFLNNRGRCGTNPSKRPSPQTYRTRNMHHAAASHLTVIASAFLADSQRNARECLLEGDWKASLNSVTHMSEKGKLASIYKDLWIACLLCVLIWNSDLKPTGLSLDESQPEDGSRAHTPRSAPAPSALSNFPPDEAATAAAAFSGYIPLLPPYAQSVASTTNITIGLAHTAFVQRHQQRLVDRQTSGSILSDPHAADMGIRFPFLVVEAKGLGQNGSLISAQNQAAISGACILVILKDLNQQAAWNTSLELDARLHALNAGPTLLTTTPPGPQPTPALCFSIVQESPVHELWVHFEHEGAVYMQYLQSWRTVSKRNAQALVRCIARTMAWGKGEFRDAIVNKLEKIPRSGAFG
ncbi:hypothetical protein B0J11DRAFT_551017 [Dendryphion nanum]|uniref:DUF7924 domain-containing protein n=1 Tax=Dendryphion nanum TaxID=256645 RepID=A0A9P9DNU5_9PLEO|nr:hypothetical protein B0J11DRAFT_551017 [Dendryphion nanum]